MLKLLVKTYLISLVESFNYPECILKFDWKKLYNLPTEVVWDFKTGCLLKIDAQKRIIDAY